MGAGPPSTLRNASSIGYDSLLELPNIHYERAMGTSRFLKTVRARHDTGALVVKVFIKPDALLSLKWIARRINVEIQALRGCPNVLPYQRAIETERAGYLIRQWGASNLYDRISTRPFLTALEKRWITFQLLSGLMHAHERNIFHGDIKSENVLVTSWNWVYLTDFSSFKPVYLPLDDPSIYSIYFDTSERRTCYIAPERFFAVDSPIARRVAALELGKKEFGRQEGKLTAAMDVFSLGCVIAELWMEGTSPFSLSELYMYRDGQHSPATYLREIEDTHIRELIESMISLNPNARHPCRHYLDAFREKAFPAEFYTHVHPFIASISDKSALLPRPSLPQRLSSASASATGTTTASTAAEHATSRPSLGPIEADDRIDKVWHEWETISSYLRVPGSPNTDASTSVHDASGDREMKLVHGELEHLRLHVPGEKSATISPRRSRCDGAGQIHLALICASIRNCRQAGSVHKGLQLLAALLPHLGDELVLDRMLPYLVSLLQDDVASVRVHALRCLTEAVFSVESTTPTNSNVFIDYIFPHTQMLCADGEETVRVAYAGCLAKLAETGRRFLELSEAMKADGTFRQHAPNEAQDGAQESSYALNLSELRDVVHEHVGWLLVDPSSQVKRALLQHIESLCHLLGRERANDAVLAHLVTYLNDRDWQLRAVFYDKAVAISQVVGLRSVEEYLLPLMILGLSDNEEQVTTAVLRSLSGLVRRRLISKARIWELSTLACGLLCHPNIWIRQATAAFVCALARRLAPTDRWCILYPTVRRSLRADVSEITEALLLDVAREPVTRRVFDAALRWAKRGTSHIWYPTRSNQKGAPRDAAVKTDEDNEQIARLEKLGMRSEDLTKLTGMREYITKRARLPDVDHASPRATLDISAGMMIFSLQEHLAHGPETVIFNGQAPPQAAKDAKPPATPSRRASSSDAGRPLSRRTRRASGEQPGEMSRASKASSQRPSLVDIPSRLPTEDEVSSPVHYGSSGIRSKNRVLSGGVNIPRAAAAISQDSTHAMGVLDADGRATAEDEIISTQTRDSSIVQDEEISIPKRYTTNYEGNDPIVLQLIESSFLEAHRNKSPELGPSIRSGIPTRRMVRTGLLIKERSRSRPEGSLVAHLLEHTDAITGLAVSPDNMFFVSASRDGSVKVWDTFRLEKNVTSRSRHTINQGGQITAVCMVEGSHCVASASDTGTLWVHRIDVSTSLSMPRYSKPELVRQYLVEPSGDFITTLRSAESENTSMLVFGTRHCQVGVLDVHTMRPLHLLANPVQHGPITALCVDRRNTWVAVGTANGVLSVWDLRFGLLLQSWRVGAGRILQMDLHPSLGSGRWVVISLETSLTDEQSQTESPGVPVVEVWDLENTVKVEEYRSALSSDGNPPSKVAARAGGKMVEAEGDYSAAIAALLATPPTTLKSRPRVARPETVGSKALSVRGGDAPGPPVGCAYAFVGGSDYESALKDTSIAAAPRSKKALQTTERTSAAYLITGGEDRRLRFWDLGRPERSIVFSGMELDEPKPTFSARRSSSKPALFLESASQMGSHGVHRSTLIANSQQQRLRSHREAVTALAVSELPFKCVISGNRVGEIRVYE